GEIFVIKTAEGKHTRRVTDSPARDRSVVWSPDGKALFFISDRGGTEQVYRATSAEEPVAALSDSMRFKIEQVTDSSQSNFNPRVSPDGKSLAMSRERGDLVIRDLKTGDERVLFESWNEPAYRWSPDSKWIAYNVEDLEHNADVWIVPAVGDAPPVNISQHPDYDENPQWAADGQILAFNSLRDGFDTDLYLVFLSPELDELSTVDQNEYFEKRAEAVKKLKPLKSALASGKIRLAGEPPLTEEEVDEDEADKPEVGSPRAQLRKFFKNLLEEPKAADKDKEDKEKDEKEKAYAYELDTAYQRIRRVTNLPSDQSNYALAPAGDLLVFASKHDGDDKVYSVKWNGKDVKRILSSGAAAMHWDLTGKKLLYLKGGVPASCDASGSGAETHKFAARMMIDHTAEAEQKFNDAARALQRLFYHPTMKGLDWPALTAKYGELAMHTRTGWEFNEVFNMFQGELNASHLAITGGERETPPSEDIGYIGCTFDPAFPGPGLKVASVLERGPASRAESKLVPGDVLLKVDGTSVGPDHAIEAALIDQVGAEVIVEFIPSPDRDEPAKEETSTEGDDNGEHEEAARDDDAVSDDEPAEPETRELVIRPISFGAFDSLTYDAWVEANRKYVEEQSGGRVGYCAIRYMQEPLFYEFERDLYAAAHDKDGLVIDVRNNGGGWTADWVMAVLSVKRHAYTIARGGAPGYPQGRLVFYAWTKPATMLCNQFSFSNAEIVAHAFKNLERGPLVGMTTYGGVISTGSYGLIDGSRIRMPGRGWYTLPDGVDMELHGAEPDVKVPETPEDEIAGRHPQLDAAIKATLEQL
ncbi:MAG: PD40 domain-containing protein, partial [Phycisphaerae bacterium]|nr:PD40 domain-containing protein [Phycisphaerae bacterium]